MFPAALFLFPIPPGAGEGNVLLCWNPVIEGLPGHYSPVTVGQGNRPRHCPTAADKAGAAQGTEEQGVLMKLCPWGCPCLLAAPAGQQLWLDPGCPTRSGPSQGHGRGWGAAEHSLPREGSLPGLFPFVSLTFACRIPPNAKLFFEVELVDIE